jgi:hypothetical protein
VSLKSHWPTDNTLKVGNVSMFWRKFNGREVRSRYNSSMVLELKKVPVKEKEEKVR